MKNNNPLKYALCASISMAAMFFALPAIADEATATETATTEAAPLVSVLFDEGHAYAKLRYRYEFVDHSAFAEDANASTARAQIGFETGTWNGLQGRIEVESIHHIGPDRFNDLTNGNTVYPVVADGDDTELNRLWVSYTNEDYGSVRLGRQGINLDNQRFIGTVGWRQNDQTYDALRFDVTAIPDLTLSYAFVLNVNRIFGNEHAMGDMGGQSHILHAAYSHADWLNVAAYAYLLDLQDLPALTSQTYGVRLTGGYPVGNGIRLGYAAEVAYQTDYEDNPVDYDEYYFLARPDVSWNGFNLAAGYELQGGNGTGRFTTPLATGHAHNGWADLFLTTPLTGLQDIFGQATYQFTDINEYLDGTKITVAYHDFESDSGGIDFGTEWDASITHRFGGYGYLRNWGIGLKYANFDADGAGGLPDVEKIWFTLDANF